MFIDFFFISSHGGHSFTVGSFELHGTGGSFLIFNIAHEEKKTRFTLQKTKQKALVFAGTDFLVLRRIIRA